MKKKKNPVRLWAGLLLLLFLFPAGAAPAEETLPAPRMEYAFSGKVKRTYESPSLIYTVETFHREKVLCYLTKIWMKDPARQIRKATASWKKNIMLPVHMAQKIPEAALVINGSGYVSPTYPWIPEDYPGTGKDYYYTPLGSLTVTDGEVFRNLEGIPYSGLTLEADGLHMYTGEDNEKVLAAQPSQTWSFYVECPMIRDGAVLTPEDWPFAAKPARRTVIARTDANNYLILTVTNEGGPGLTLHQVNAFFLENFTPEWVYDLDGGPSSALLCRKPGGKKMVTLMGGSAKDADIMAFVELPEEAP